MGDRARPAARRRARQPHRPVFRAPGVFEGTSSTSSRPALRRLQPRRLGDRVRRHPDGAAVLRGVGPGRHRPQGLTRGPTPQPVSTGAATRRRGRPAYSTGEHRSRDPQPAGARRAGGRARRRRPRPAVRVLAHQGRRAGRGGEVQVDGAVVGKSDRVHGGAWLEVELPRPAAPVQIVAEPVAGMGIVYDDDDIVVVDKPVGVAAHPSPGWTGPTVLGGLAAAGYRISTTGAAERQGIVHRLDVGTSGLMVVAKTERAYTALKRRSRSARSRSSTTRSSRATRTRSAARSTRRSAGTPPRLQVGRHRRRQALRHALRPDRGVPRGLPARHPAGDRAHPPDPRAHVRAPPPLRRRPDLRRRPHARQAAAA